MAYLTNAVWDRTSLSTRLDHSKSGCVRIITTGCAPWQINLVCFKTWFIRLFKLFYTIFAPMSRWFILVLAINVMLVINKPGTTFKAMPIESWPNHHLLTGGMCFAVNLNPPKFSVWHVSAVLSGQCCCAQWARYDGWIKTQCDPRPSINYSQTLIRVTW